MFFPIRVLQVFAHMNRGGAESMIMNLYRSIDRSRVQFDFVVHTEKKCAFDEEISQLGGRIFSVPQYRGRNHSQYYKCWKAFFSDHPEYKIVHGHMRSTASIYLNIARSKGLFTIAHSHSTSSGTGFGAIAKNILQYPIRYRADYFFACSQDAGEWLFGKKVCKSDRFKIMNNAIDAKRFAYDEKTRIAMRKELGIEDRFIIGHVGRIDKPKNHKFLIDIFNETHKKNAQALLLIVGDGALRSEIEEQVCSMGLSQHVLFTGIRSDISNLLQAMDVFVFPSIYEGLPVALVEAQASGLRCFVSDRITKAIGITELVEFISLDCSKEYWAKKVLSVNDKGHRRNTYDDISKAGYDVRENADWLEKFYVTKYKELE